MHHIFGVLRMVKMVMLKQIRTKIVLAFLLLLLLVSVLFKIVQVEGNSMYPTIKSGTILLVHLQTA